MLGYMRHGGFIPWDDDVDCAMLRKDYDRFLAEAGPLLKEGYFLQTRQSDPNIPYLFSKIRLDNTEYATEYNAERDFHIGICLDIFPFDYIPDDPDERKAFREQVRELSKAHNTVANAQMPYPKEVCQPRNELEERYIREQKEKLDYYWSQDLKETQEAYLKVATAFNEDGEAGKLRTVASFVPSYTFIDVDNLLPYQRGKFEDIEVSVPKRPDIFLKMQYKDYMSLPPKHNQVAHRLVRWSTWEESWDKIPETEESSASPASEKEDKA
jgi:lipopolysaccharide cholinephosphotransferase